MYILEIVYNILDSSVTNIDADSIADARDMHYVTFPYAL